jgi:predicted hotdog family 3-hydroxylacyl-ACP dehydratase
VSAVSPAALLRHREPALLLGEVESFDGRTLACSARGARSWRWPEMLEAAAQAAGLLVGLQPGGLDNTAVIAEYRAVAVYAPNHRGPLQLVAALERRILRFWRCRFEVRAPDGTVLLEGRVTLAPRVA